jgi:hypothetical protein
MAPLAKRYTGAVLGRSYPPRENARRLLILAIVAAAVFVPGIVALVMLLTGNAG